MRLWRYVSRLWARHQRAGQPGPHHANHHGRHRADPTDWALAVLAVLLVALLVVAALLKWGIL